MKAFIAGTLATLVAALEGLATALIGFMAIILIAIPLWIFTFNLEASPAQLAQIVCAAWLFAHRVPILLPLAAQLTPTATDSTVLLSLPPFALTLLSAVLAVRAGMRTHAKPLPQTLVTLTAGATAFGLAGYAAATVAAEYSAWPVPLAAVTTFAIYMICSAAGFASKRYGSKLVGIAGGLGTRALRQSLATLAALLATVAGALAVAIFAGYADATALAQSLQLDVLGVILLFCIQLLYLPVALSWGAAWLSGSGFTLGVTETASPFTSVPGPLPALPLFTAIPEMPEGLGLLAPLLITLSGVMLGVLYQRHDRGTDRAVQTLPIVAERIIVLFCAALTTAIAVTVLGFLTSGAIGPGRLAQAGPNPLQSGTLIGCELLAGMLLGFFVASRDYRYLDDTLRRAWFRTPDKRRKTMLEHPSSAASTLTETEATAETVEAAEMAEMAESLLSRSSRKNRAPRNRDRNPTIAHQKKEKTSEKHAAAKPNAITALPELPEITPEEAQ